MVICMNFKTNKDKGNSGLGMAIAFFTTNGYTVSIPLNDTQDYDLIVEKDGIFQSVQVKATGCKTKYDIYQVPLKSCGGTKGTTYKTLKDTKVDLLFILTSNSKCYLIPIEEINNKTTLNLSNSILNYEVKL